MKKIELEKELNKKLKENEALASNVEELLTDKNALTVYVAQIQNRVREVENLTTHYEKTVTVMGGRIQEKNTLISEQNNKIMEREI